MPTTLKIRLAWLLLALTLCQAWAAVRHVHEWDDGGARALAQAQPTGVRLADAVSPQAGAFASEADAPDEERSGEAHCDCLWCATRLHVLIAYALPVPEPPAVLVAFPFRSSAPGFAFSPTPRGTVPPPRGPPA